MSDQPSVPYYDKPLEDCRGRHDFISRPDPFTGQWITVCRLCGYTLPYTEEADQVHNLRHEQERRK